MASVIAELTKKPTSEDVSIPQEPSKTQWILAGVAVGVILLGYAAYQHFYMKKPGFLSLPNGEDRNELLRAIGLMLAATAAVYALFLGLGIAASAGTAYQSCGKTDITESAKQGALFAINPAVTYLIARLFEMLRRHYDRVLVYVGVRSAVWSIAAFMATWIIFQAILLVDESERQICKPDVNEATAFKNAVLAQEQERKNQQLAKKVQLPPVGQATN